MQDQLTPHDHSQNGFHGSAQEHGSVFNSRRLHAFPLRDRYLTGDRSEIDEVSTRTPAPMRRHGDMVSAVVLRVAISDPGACWPWLGQVKGGYGRFPVKCSRGTRTNTSFQAHRLAYDLSKGPIPEGLVVRHMCHNPICCNPAHLEVGTNADNMRDMVEAGRSTAGEKNPRARITAEQAREICRAYYEEGETLKSLGTRYGVHLATIGFVVQGKTWGDATIDLREEYEERAAIMQHMGGLSQATAEEQALKRVLLRKKASKAKRANLGTEPQRRGGGR